MKRIISKIYQAGGRTRSHKRDDLDHWAMLDAESGKAEVPTANGKNISGESVRRDALEWLRLESVRLAWKTSSPLSLRLASTHDWDLKHARGSVRDGLIKLPPTPITWVYPYYPRGFMKEFSFEVLNHGDTSIERPLRESRSGRVVVSIDPRYSTPAIAALTKFLHAKRNGKHDRDGGTKYRLVRLREALLSYETWLTQALITPKKFHGPQIHPPTSARNNKAMRDIGKNLQSYKAYSGKQCIEDVYEKRAQKILTLAREMLRIAAFEDTTVWIKEFR